MQEGEKTIARYFDRHERSGYPFDAIALQVANDFTPPFKTTFGGRSRLECRVGISQAAPFNDSRILHYIETQNKDCIPICEAARRWVGGLATGRGQFRGAGRQTENYLPMWNDCQRWPHWWREARAGRMISSSYNELLLWEEHTIEWYDIRADIYVDESREAQAALGGKTGTRVR